MEAFFLIKQPVLTPRFGAISIFDALILLRTCNGFILFVYIATLGIEDLFKNQFLALPFAVIVSGLFWALPHEDEANQSHTLLQQAILLLILNASAMIFLSTNINVLAEILFFVAFAATNFENYTVLPRNFKREVQMIPLAVSEISICLFLFYGLVSHYQQLMVFCFILGIRSISLIMMIILMQRLSRHEFSFQKFWIKERVLKYSVPRLGSTVGVAILANSSQDVISFATFVRFLTLSQLFLPSLVRISSKFNPILPLIFLVVFSTFGYSAFSEFFIDNKDGVLSMLIMASTITTLFIAEKLQYGRFYRIPALNSVILYGLSLGLVAVAVFIWFTNLKAEFFYFFNALAFVFIYRYA